MTNQSKVAGRRSLRAILRTVIAILLMALVFAQSAMAGTLSPYNVTVIDNGVEITVTTTETEPIEILTKAGINTNSIDKIDLSSFTKGEGGKIVISTPVPFCVSLTADDVTKKYTVTGGTVNNLLILAGINLGEDDYTEPSITTPLDDGMEITVYRVEYKTKIQTEKMKYSTIQKKDKNLAKGTKKTVTKGVNGQRKVTYEVKYVNGEVDSKAVISQKVDKKPTSKVVKVGSKKVGGIQDVKSNGVDSKNGYKVGQQISGRYTHYCACAKCNGNSRGITSSGKKIRNGMKNPYYIACNWLPLGSVVEVEGVNYMVVDRGGSGLSRKGRIDIFTPEGHSTCYKYGTGSCTIRIVRLGW